MAIKIAVLKNGEKVICDLYEAIDNDILKGYILKEPQLLEVNDSVKYLTEETEPQDSMEVILSPWIPLSEETEIFVIWDFIAAVVTPLDTLKSIYNQKVNKNDN